MRALGWDDKPDEYLARLRPHLAGYGITLEIESDVGAFLRRLNHDRWDFVVTDLFSPTVPGAPTSGPVEGARIANTATELGLPVFVLTQEYERAIVETVVPRSAILKSKRLPLTWTAEEIVYELGRMGAPVDKTRVFVISGHDSEAVGATEALRGFLRGKSLHVDEISPENLVSEIAAGLLTRMHDCAAFVAVCTPDDEWRDGTRHPRQNVMLEVGMALGLARGLKRLTILQRTGPLGDKEKLAELPSDLSGILTLRFADRIDAVFGQLEKRLRSLGVEIV